MADPEQRKKCAANTGRKFPRMGDRSEDDIVAALRGSSSLQRAAEAIGISRHKATQTAIRLGIDLSHMRPGRNRPTPDSTLFSVKLGEGRKDVRKRFLQHSEYRCTVCELPPEWNGKPLVLHLDHVNGNAEDHRLSNLRWLCPNCHTQTETYTGRKTRGRRKRQ